MQSMLCTNVRLEAYERMQEKGTPGPSAVPRDSFNSRYRSVSGTRFGREALGSRTSHSVCSSSSAAAPTATCTSQKQPDAGLVAPFSTKVRVRLADGANLKTPPVAWPAEDHAPMSGPDGRLNSESGVGPHLDLLGAARFQHREQACTFVRQFHRPCKAPLLIILTTPSYSAGARDPSTGRESHARPNSTQSSRTGSRASLL